MEPSSELSFALETAACIWEAVLTLRDHPATDPGSLALACDIRETCDEIGTASLRLAAVEWTAAVDKAWREVEDDYPASFDWDFVPNWIIAHVDWSARYVPAVRPAADPTDSDAASADHDVDELAQDAPCASLACAASAREC